MEKPLQNSHIVSEFLYETMYNARHQTFGFCGPKMEILQKGVREPLLCRRCEQQFGRYEKYAAEAFFRRDPGAMRTGNFELVFGLQYSALKLFLLSLLWRFGETSIPLLAGAELGPHREKLRQLLYDEDAGDYQLYPCVIREVSMNGKTWSNLIMPPKRSRSGNHRLWNMVLAGYILSFYVSSHPLPNVIEPMLLKPSGSLGVWHVELREVVPLVKEVLDCVNQLNANPEHGKRVIRP